MVNRLEVLALIPARGGSKGIPRKNLRDFAGAPLIAYSIAAALQAELVTRVIVSTDDSEIAEVARAWGAETPFVRPAQFAQDDSTDLPVFEHALQWLRENEGYQPEIVIQLRPTSPIRPVGLLDDGFARVRISPIAPWLTENASRKLWKFPVKVHRRVVVPCSCPHKGLLMVKSKPLTGTTNDD